MPHRAQIWHRDPVRATELLVPEIVADPENAYVPEEEAYQAGIADALADYLTETPGDLGRIVKYSERMSRSGRLSLLSQVAGTNGYASTPRLREALFESDVTLDAEVAASVFVPAILLDPDKIPLPSRASDGRLLGLLGLVHVQSHPDDVMRLERFIRRLPGVVRAELVTRAVDLGVSLSDAVSGTTSRGTRGV